MDVSPTELRVLDSLEVADRLGIGSTPLPGSDITSTTIAIDRARKDLLKALGKIAAGDWVLPRNIVTVDVDRAPERVVKADRLIDALASLEHDRAIARSATYSVIQLGGMAAGTFVEWRTFQLGRRLLHRDGGVRILKPRADQPQTSTSGFSPDGLEGVYLWPTGRFLSAVSPIESGETSTIESVTRRPVDAGAELGAEVANSEGATVGDDEDSSDSRRIAILAKLTPAQRKAYSSREVASLNFALDDSSPTEKELYDWLQERYDFNDDDVPEELKRFELPAFETWARQCRHASKALDEQKYQKRSRTIARSIVRLQDRDSAESD